MQLNWLNITTPLTIDTPLCVLQDVAEAHNVCFELTDTPESLLQAIHHAPTITVNINSMTAADFSTAAIFVNQHCTWKRGAIRLALSWIHDFARDIKSYGEHYRVQGRCGPIIPDCIQSLNSCMLYRICLEHKLIMYSHTTEAELIHMVQLVQHESVKIKDALVTHITQLPRALLVELATHLHVSVPIPPPDTCTVMSLPQPCVMEYSNMETMYPVFNNLAALRKLIIPTRDMGAVALGAISMRQDFSYATDPIKTYLEVKNQQPITDNWYRLWLRLNPDMFNLTKTFNPLLPAAYYEALTLNQLAHQAGYSKYDLERDSSYNLLQTAYLTETFYAGLRPGLYQERTVINRHRLTKVVNGQIVLSPKLQRNLVSYGHPGTTFKCYTLDELNASFRSTKDFSNCGEAGMVFDSIAIVKLQRIALMWEHRDLVGVIEDILHFKGYDVNTQEFIVWYRDATPAHQEQVVQLLRLILQMGMYMRGWTGAGPYPLEKAPLNIQAPDEVMIAVTDQYRAYDLLCKGCAPEVVTQVQNLPLVRRNDTQYRLSDSDFDGLTVGRRIEIARDGDTQTNMAGCIRLTSNWLCASMHRYLIIVGEPAPFELYKLAVVG